MNKVFLILLVITCSINPPDADAQWQQTSVNAADITCLLSMGNNVFGGSFSNGVFLSSDNGVTWKNVNKGLPDSSATNIRGLGAIGNTVFAGTISGLYVSADTGANWTKVNDSLLQGSATFAFGQIGSNFIAGISGDGVFLSPDTGKSWMPVDSGLTDIYENAFAVSGSNVFAGAYLGIFLSTDSCKSWTAVDSGLTTKSINTLAASGTNIFAATNDGSIFLSSNNGISWTKVDNNANAVLALAATGPNVFAGTEGSGMLFTKDDGATWTPENTGLINLNLNSLVINGSYIYAGTYGNGIQKFLLTNIILATENINPNNYDISIFPNPAANELTIQSSCLHNAEITVSVMNMLGKTSPPTSLQMRGESATIDVSDLPAGMYLLQLKGESGSVVKKFVKSVNTN